MFGNMFRGMIMGKGNRPDLTPEDLPSNRWALFFAMFRIRWGKLVQLNLTFLLFLLPMVIWGGINIVTMNQVAVGVLDGTSDASMLLSLLFFWLMVNIPLSIPAGLGQAGMAFVCRNWARDQHAWPWSDFIDTIKKNWKQAIGVSLFTSAGTYLLAVAFVQYPTIVGSPLFGVFLQALVGVMMAMLWLIQILIWPMMVTYELKFGTLLRNSAVLIIARLPFAVAVGIGILLPIVAIALIPSGIVMLIGLLFYAVIGMSLTAFVSASFANAVFDRFINPRIAGAPVNQGLAPKEIDEEDAFDPDVWNQFDDTKGPKQP